MSGNISEAMIIGIAIIMVASLVSTGLNLMVMSNSLLSGGTTTLQSGIDSISTQEFASFDNTKVSGTQVKTALSQFQGRDVAIIIQTKALAAIDGSYEDYAINYGALLCTDGNSSAGATNKQMTIAIKVDTTKSPVEYTYGEQGGTGSFADAETAVTITRNGASHEFIKVGNILTSQAKTANMVKFTESSKPSGSNEYALWRENGAANYTGYLHNTNGLVDSSYDTIGTTELGNAAYLLGSARFSATLIKDPTGSIIGIFFKQLT